MKINIKIYLILLITFILIDKSYAQQAQNIKMSIRKGTGVNQLDILLKPDFNNRSGEYLNQVEFSIGVPTTSGLIGSATATTGFKDLVFSSSYPVSSNETLIHFNGTNTVPTPTSMIWTANTEFVICTITFDGHTGDPSPKQFVRLVDSSLSADNSPTSYVNLSSNIINSDPNVLGNVGDPIHKFYQTVGSNSPNYQYNTLTSPPPATTDTSQMVQFVNTTSLVVLPITLSSFNATKSGATVILNWLVSAEINAKGYDVERSANGINFSAINNVPATNSSKYNVTDVKPLNGTNYYRLKMVDIDGNFKYSEVRTVLFDATAVSFDISPNPVVTNTMYLNLQQYSYAGKAQAMITDIDGRNVQSININIIKGNNQLPVTLKSLISGTYFVTVYDTKGNVIGEPKKIVKQ